LDWRTNYGQHSRTRANRERALLSHVFNMARNWGVIETDNPCRGIKGYTESGRDIYVEDEIFDAVFKEACKPLQHALELAYLISQRPVEVIKITINDIIKGFLHITQTKTGKKLRIQIEGKLKNNIDKLLRYRENRQMIGTLLICTETEKSISQQAMAQRFVKARQKAAIKNPEIKNNIKRFQFRDLRAKGATDLANSEGMFNAKQLTGHSSIKMTEHYVKNRIGDIVKPLK
jgi:integrase